MKYEIGNMKYERKRKHRISKEEESMTEPAIAKPARLKSFQERGHDFALEIIRLYIELSSRPVDQCIGKQLLRSGTSVGAQLSESKRSRSRAEVISKTESALQELEESVYWMKLLRDTAIIKPQRVDALLEHADRLTAILISGARKLKSRNNGTR